MALHLPGRCEDMHDEARCHPAVSDGCVPQIESAVKQTGGVGAARDRSALGAAHSAAMRTSGAAARTSASTCFSYFTKFCWNMPTSLRAVASKAALSFQVFIG